MIDQHRKAEAFHALQHEGCFILPNPWDVGSAKILQGLGFKALATTSAGFANSLGLQDYEVTRDRVIAHARVLCDATHIPVSADLENGFGDAPETCAETIRFAAAAGLVGGSIEDFSSELCEQYSLEQSRERIAAAVDAAKSLPFRFTLTARAENFFTGIPDLGDTISRLQAYQEAGADVLFAPGLQTVEDIRSVLASIDRPLNVLIGPFKGFISVADLAELGVRRISLGSSLSNAAHGALIEAGRELLTVGTFGYTENGVGGSELAGIMNGDNA